MAEPFPNADPLSDDQPDMTGDAPPDQGDAAGEASPARFKQKKLLVVLGGAMLGGALLGVGGMALVTYLQPADQEPHVTPIIAAPAPEPKQDALAAELEALKVKNEKLEEQLKQAAQMPPVSAPMPDIAQLPVPPSALEQPPLVAQAPAPRIRRSRSADKNKENITADCTVPDKVDKLSDKLKACIEDFNASTH